MRQVYLDANATTPLDPAVREQAEPWISGEHFGNAGSPHAWGDAAREAVESARKKVAKLAGGVPRDVLFTSGATESNNLALAARRSDGRRHVISCVAEHPSVREPLSAHAEDGQLEATWIPVDDAGRIDVDEIRAAIRPDTFLISVMAANNETGTVHPLAELGGLASENDLLFHCDAAQGAGRIPLDVQEMHIDLLSLSAHKMYGPMGIGALYVSSRARPALSAQIRGGGQQQGLRSGTVNVGGAVGIGAACEVAGARLFEDAAHLESLRNRFEASLVELGDVQVNGDRDVRLPSTTNLTIEGVPAEALIAGCPELAFSAGSACSTGSPAPSHVLAAMGLNSDAADCSVRFGLTRFTSESDIDFALDLLRACVERVRALVHA